MGAQIVSFFMPREKAKSSADWSQQELAEFYRVENALIRAGLRVETDRGVSDEGEPWFVFLRAEDGEVVIHFARIDGEYLIAGPAYEKIARGFDFGALVRNMIARHPLVQPQRRDGNVYLHPSAILIAIVGTAFFKSGEAKAMDDAGGAVGSTRTAASAGAPALRKAPASTQAAHPAATASINQPYSVAVDANQALAIIAGAMMALEIGDARMGSAAAHNVATNIVSAPDSVQPLSIDHDAKTQIDRGVPKTQSAPQPMGPEQIAKLLGVIAVLNDLATPTTTSTAAPPAIAVETGAERGSNTAPVTETANNPAAWLIDIRLSSTGEPLAEAAQLVRQVVFGGSFEHVAVIELATLPALLVNILAKGLQIDGAGLAPATIDGSVAGGAPGAEAPLQHAAGHSDGAPVPLAVDGAPIPVRPSLPVVETPAAVAPAPAAPAPPAAPEPIFSSKAAVDIFVSYFLSHSVRPEVVVAAKTVVIFDQDVLRMDPSTIESVTFQFDDGSAISLIGAIKSMHHDIGLG